MSEETTAVRPTKKQRELLEFISTFISEHGYSPSYREIMNGLQYNSVATVALHVRNLIQRGHLQKRGRSARSLEVVGAHVVAAPGNSGGKPQDSHEQWLLEHVEKMFKELESAEKVATEELDKLFVLVGALKVLGHHEASALFVPRLTALEHSAVSTEA